MPLRSRLHDVEELNLTPLIDVMFNLLIVALLGSTYVRDEEAVPLDLPKVAAAAPLADSPDEIDVVVTPDGSVRFGAEVVSMDELKTRLADAVARYPDQRVAVRGDRAAVYEPIARVIALCKEAGVRKLDVVVLEEK
ncbi:MAG: ExbD/TolR family protein [Planctomycetia bacterium]